MHNLERERGRRGRKSRGVRIHPSIPFYPKRYDGLWIQICLLLEITGKGREGRESAKGNAEGLDGHDSQPSEAGERPFPPPGP